MSKVSLKKYLKEISDYPLDYFLNYKMKEFALNYSDEPTKSEITVKQATRTITDKVELNVKTWITVLGVSATKNFLERLLRNLPQYERKDPLVIELAFAISHEIKKIDLINAELLASLNITTSNPITVKRFEKIYNVNTRYELGLLLRQNILIARRITKFYTFNFEYLMKICELFKVGEVADITNDKNEQTLTIVLKNNLESISAIDEFRAHLNEFSPAWYSINITN